MTAALGLALTTPALAAMQAPPAIECSAVAGFVASWTVAGEPLMRLVVHGAVTSLSAGGDAAYTTLCDPPAPRVVCVEQSAAGLAIGDAVTLEGVVARADAAELVLDPCGSILRR